MSVCGNSAQSAWGTVQTSSLYAFPRGTSLCRSPGATSSPADTVPGQAAMELLERLELVAHPVIPRAEAEFTRQGRTQTTGRSNRRLPPVSQGNWDRRNPRSFDRKSPRRAAQTQSPLLSQVSTRLALGSLPQATA
jgi:hypothetical protein